jgi:putative hemolysin
LETAEGDYCTSIIISMLASLPQTAEVLVYLLFLALLILCSAFISGSEVAFFSIKGHEAEMLNQHKTRSGTLVKQLLERPRLLLATILISNNMVNIAIIIFATMVFHVLFDFSQNPIFAFLIEVVTVTFILVLLGEIIPKVYATQRNFAFAGFMAYPMLFLTRIFYPFAIILVKYSTVIEKRMSKKGHEVSITDIKKAIEMTSNELTNHEETRLLQGIVNFSNTSVRQIMISRVDVIAYDVNTSFPELIELINEHRYSRVPVYEDTFDNIVGVLYIKDILPHIGKENFKWNDLLRKPYFVPETKMVDDLLKEFQVKKVHLAVVVDEYGGTSGIITLEDILEEIVGDIFDEFDVEEVFYSKLDENNYVFDAKTSISDVIRVMNLDDDVFDPLREEADTLGGLILEILGRMPQTGEKIEYNNFSFIIESADKKRIRRVKITKQIAVNK